MSRNDFIHRGGLWVLTQNILILVVFGLGLKFRQQDWHWSIGVVGSGLLLASAVFGVAGVFAMGKNLSPYPKPRNDGQLVQTGIYAFVRHPLYSSLVFLGIGWSLLRGSWPALATALVLAMVLDAKARLEERWLRQQHPAYAEYAARVRRFIPGVY